MPAKALPFAQNRVTLSMVRGQSKDFPVAGGAL
jgi:hypothetical protein